MLKGGVECRRAGVRLTVLCLRLTAAHLAARRGSVASRVSPARHCHVVGVRLLGIFQTQQRRLNPLESDEKSRSANVFVFVVGNVPIQLRCSALVSMTV
ncbi:hypothetical protein QQF64_005425 [Cirrhinus molitorella]|uniref:Secreted protein n=1 Tax=Cirrhinus molitorella TaxID=172907 RepID=A0ABR3MC97_9TELE